MPENPAFPHLRLSAVGSFRPKFPKSGISNAEAKSNTNNRPIHLQRLRESIGKFRDFVTRELERRRAANLPIVTQGGTFMMRVPEGIDPDALSSALGVELVAEADGGFLLAAVEDLTLSRIEEVLKKFEDKEVGGGSAANLLEVFSSPDDPRRLSRILSEPMMGLWPFAENQEYIFDASIQTAEGTHSFTVPTIRKRKGETDDALRQRRVTQRQAAFAQAEDRWTTRAEQRFGTLKRLIDFYQGTLLTGITANPPQELDSAIVFSDSFQIRARVSGAGWRDIILNFPNLFEVSLPDDVSQPLPPSGVARDQQPPEILSPDSAAATVCVIDSGIQEGHIWLQPAIDSQSSRCFLPGRRPDDVQDEVRSGGHGTRVAGAILYPDEVPRNGTVRPALWLQNARVLDRDNQIPTELPPPRYVEDVVAHFHATLKKTRLFNHSISGNTPCLIRRMSAWAAKIDELSHSLGVLFIQAAGNILGTDSRHNSPGIHQHLISGKRYPDYLEEAASRIASPAQSLQALTVGSVAGRPWRNESRCSIAPLENSPSAFSRSGLGSWDSIKPDVVEIGGDYARANDGDAPPTIEEEIAVDLIRATGDGGPAIAKDGVGTSYAAPKVSYLAALLQNLFPAAHALLYRGLIVHSARWPTWLDSESWTADRALRLMGFGIPATERAMQNEPHRVTLITSKVVTIQNSELHLYQIIVPDELRNRSGDTIFRIDVTLSYSSAPRRTRSSRRGYLATWLDWRSSNLREPLDSFWKRMVAGEEKPARTYPGLNWSLHYYSQYGDAQETHRGNGTIQKDWARLPGHELPEEFGLAVRAHKGWDHRDNAGGANYCLIVSIEAESVSVPVYATIAEANVEVTLPIESEVRVQS